ncbi:MAG: DUF3365 domain-containing protein [Sporocytophaga sp.]|uniref:c-type heme family protein n=1 Tax=Sporocytophaga sp. TaxID=2231183 RepID=UPI001B0BA7C8|nr:DUF3365 domain-containing protein [Sporocytophaga sp.]MBO9700813.1 DUF3365 domain-containing protein [Sporocytophaga sp.]
MKNKNLFILSLLIFVTLNVYLFVEAPSPLPEYTGKGAIVYSVEDAFRIVAMENNVVRRLYTKEIVGEGIKRNFKFDEHWRNESIEAGPLPALFLRSVSSNLEKHSSPLGVFLGSDYPISPSNKFSGKQQNLFNQIRKDRLPKFFFDDDTKRYTAMFPDFASTITCVNCHNNHKDSPKRDWELGDMMGATTWTYPSDSLSFQEVQEMVNAYRNGVEQTYLLYLSEVQGFKQRHKPEIGSKWPKDGYYIPELKSFMDSVNIIASPYTLSYLLSLK